MPRGHGLRSILGRGLRYPGYLLAAAALVAGAAYVYLQIEIHRIAAERTIDGGRGIVEARFIDLNGTENGVEIRGHDQDNPVLLFLHGGPGYSAIPDSYRFQTPWEKHFTVVQWDQRCAGRTFEKNGIEGCGELSVDSLVADARALAEYLRRRLDKDRIALVAHSWGSLLGLNLISRYPELFSGYVASGQIVQQAESRRLMVDWVLGQARAENNQEAIAALTAAPYDPATTPDRAFRWAAGYGGNEFRLRRPWQMAVSGIWNGWLQPEVAPGGAEAWLEAYLHTRSALMPEKPPPSTPAPTCRANFRYPCTSSSVATITTWPRT